MQSHLEVAVTFVPVERTVHVLPGTSLLEACARADLVLQTPCGGIGACGKCRVRVLKGETESADNPHLSRNAFRQGWRLACATRILTPLEVEIPETSRFTFSHKILTDHDATDLDIAPSVTVETLSLPDPSPHDGLADVERLEQACNRILRIPPTCLSVLPTRLRETGRQLQVVLEGDCLLDVLPSSPPIHPLGLAVDLGTTTVVCTLIDLSTGRELGMASGVNRQIQYGDDVLSRIDHVRKEASRLKKLQQAAIETLNALIDKLCEKGFERQRIYRMVLAGNSTMQQLLLAVDPRPLGEMPFVPAFNKSQTFRAGTLGLRIPEEASVTVFPQPGGFVGGDTVAGMLAVNFDRLTDPTLLVDIGTNGELALTAPSGLYCSSTAAGPAFEGARIRQGMRAENGAIEKVVCRNGDLEVNVIGNTAPRGLCGSALIDAVAECLRLGLVDETGRICGPDAIPGNITHALRSRIEADGESFQIRLSDASGPDKGVYLCQRDIRELQLASGAMRAGIDILIARAGLKLEALTQILVAGAFGNFIRRSNAERIGLLPPLPHHRIRYIGNASSMGAKMALLSTTAFARCESIRKRCRHVDLNSDPGFQDAFASAMLFPAMS